MPEIKNSFKQGVMNKDLDERLVPNGQFRDAMNVQVSTSESSEVGTVQNILGNERVEEIVGPGYRCVGAVSDEKNDVLYWFVSSLSTDAIIEYNDNGLVTPILVDTKANTDDAVLKFSTNPDYFVTGINVIDDLIFWTDNTNEPKKINITAFKRNNHTDLFTHSTMFIKSGSIYYAPGDVTEDHITVIRKRPQKAPAVVFSETALQDSYSLYNNQLGVTINDQPDPATGDPHGLNLFNFTTGDTGTTRVHTTSGSPGWQIGDIMLLKLDGTTGSLPNSYDVKIEITSALTAVVVTLPVLGSFTFAWEFDFTVLEIAGSYSNELLAFNVMKEVDVNPIFEKELIRFGTRYKYADGEYSAFSPFTQPVFLAGVFGFHPTKDPYNLGMTNNSVGIRLQDLVPTDIPDDVVQLDILFKKERSTTIYSIDSIRQNDPAPNNWFKNTYAQRSILDQDYPFNGAATIAPYTTPHTYGYKGEYNITVENIYAAIPDNQILRPWDNVPRKALAQEITGNRVVYGNYLQNYNLTDAWSNPVKTDIIVDKEQRTFFNETLNYSDNLGRKSIKSLRNYYLGIVYGDKYGRETPVFTSQNATIKIPFDQDSSPAFNGTANKSLRLTAKLGAGAMPDWAYYFKYFIKQTTGEYYNLTMDRVYKADGDDNLWISFPSSDRNKVVEGDYFAIKKQVDIESIVPVENNIKIIDIKNEAPETIKFNYVSLGTAGENNPQELWPSISQHPAANVRNLKLNIETWLDVENGSSLEDLTKSDRLAIQFSVTATGTVLRSKKYFVSGFSIDDTVSPGAADGYYNFILRETISEQDSWVESSAGVLNTAQNLTTTIYKLEQKDAVEFEGRFFVKIISSPVTQTYLLPSASDIYNYQTLAQASMFNFIEWQSSSLPSGSSGGIFNTEGGGALGFGNLASLGVVTTGFQYVAEGGTNWVDNTVGPNNFGSDTINPRSGWFLDNVGFAAAQQGDTSDPRRSGKMYKGLSGLHTTWNEAEFINGMEGIISPTISGTPGNVDIINSPYNTSGGLANGPRHWSSRPIYLDNQSNVTAPEFAGGGDFTNSPYIPVGSHDYSISGTFPGAGSGKGVDGGHWIHLSFMAPGKDLHDNDFALIDSAFDQWDTGGGSPPTDAVGVHSLFFGATSLDFFDKIFPTNCWVDGAFAGDDNQWGFQNKTGMGLGEYAVNIENNHYVKNSGTVGTGNSSPGDHWDPGFDNPSAQSVIDNIYVGSKFVFENDSSSTPEEYTIKSFEKVYLYNNIAWNWEPTYDGLGNTGGSWPGSGGAKNASVSYYLQTWNEGVGWGDSQPGSNDEWTNLKQAIYEFGRAANRRTCYIIQIDKDPRQSIIDENHNATVNAGSQVPFPESADVTGAQILQFVTNYIEPGQNTLPVSPAIFETEAKEDVDLNVYYEASDALPITLDSDVNDLRGHLLGPVGNKVSCDIAFSSPNYTIANNQIPGNDFYTRVAGWEGNIVELNGPGLKTNPGGQTATPTLFNQTTIYSGGKLKFWREDLSYTEAVIDEVIEISTSGIYVTKIKLLNNTCYEKVGLPYYNCFSFGNGVESNRVRDDFNESFILNGVKASTVLEEPYEEERRKYGLIYSGIYNTISGVNNLNQFIQAEKITKDLMPSYGSIQKLYARDKDLVTLCEDKIIRVYVDKDILYNADGNTQLLATNRVLGTAEPFRGNFGISTNPESFAAESFRAYFTDKQRGAVIRLSMDGITPISDAGMHDYFRDILPISHTLLGSFDAYKGNYNLTMKTYGSSKPKGPRGPSDPSTSYNSSLSRYTPSTPTPSSSTLNLCDSKTDSLQTLNIGETPVTNNNPVWAFFVQNAMFTFSDYTYTQYHAQHQGTCPEDQDATGYKVKTYIQSYNIDVLPGPSTAGMPVGNYVFTNVSELAVWYTDLVNNNVPSTTVDGYLLTMYPVVVDCDCVPPPPPPPPGIVGCLDQRALNYDPTAVEGCVPDCCEYEITDFTVSYNELAKGWVSFKSFTPELGISSVNQYYTMFNGGLYKHHTNENRNTFYNDQLAAPFTESSVTPILNSQPGIIKNFNTLNYEGSQTKVDVHLLDDDYYNLYEKRGWYVEEIFTDKQEGSLNEFIEKEGKWFNYIKGKNRQAVDVSAFNFQGLGMVELVSFCSPCDGTAGEIAGCCDPTATNYLDSATCEDGSCVYPPSWNCIGGGVCGDPGNGQGQYFTLDMCECACRCVNEVPPCVCGCMDDTAQNYNPLATVDDNSCMFCVDFQQHAGSFITWGRFGNGDGTQAQSTGGGAQDFVVHLHANAGLIASGPWRFDFSHGAGNHPSDPRPTDTVNCGQPSNEFPLHTFYLTPGQTHVYHGPMYFDKHAFMVTVNEGQPNECSGGCSVGGGGGLSPCIGYTNTNSTFNPNNGTWGKAEDAYNPCGWDGLISPTGALASGSTGCGCIRY